MVHMHVHSSTTASCQLSMQLCLHTHGMAWLTGMASEVDRTCVTPEGCAPQAETASSMWGLYTTLVGSA